MADATQTTAVDTPVAALEMLRFWWHSLTPDEQRRQRQHVRGGPIAAELTIDADGNLWCEVRQR